MFIASGKKRSIFIHMTHMFDGGKSFLRFVRTVYLCDIIESWGRRFDRTSGSVAVKTLRWRALAVHARMQHTEAAEHVLEWGGGPQE